MCIVGFLDLARDDRENETFISAEKESRNPRFLIFGFSCFLCYGFWETEIKFFSVFRLSHTMPCAIMALATFMNPAILAPLT